MDPAIIVVINGRAENGSGDSASKLKELFLACGQSVEILVAPENGLVATAKKAAQSGAEIVVAGGGDGTVACVAAAVMGSGKTFGVLPLGTLNHFSKDLKIPQKLDEAVRTIVSGQTIKVDVAEVNGRIFLNTSSLGIYPLVIAERESEQHRSGRGKWAAFAGAFLRILRRYPLMQVRIVADQRAISRRTPSVFVGNNVYELNGLELGTRRTLQDGKLGVYVTRDTSRWGVFRLLLRAFFRKLDATKDYDALVVEEAWVEARKPSLLVATDGEVTTMAGPLHYRIRPGALSVRVPVESKTT